MLRISYETEGFPVGTISNQNAELTLNWDDILWAAVTVGRPNRSVVFQHGNSSLYEAVFRWSLVRMALEQSGWVGYRLRRSNAAKTLDPTEKGAVNYFLGMTFCKLFAAKLLNTPWLLHLDVFRPQLNVVLAGRSRPDLIGKEHGSNRWHAFECKGRGSPPDRAAMSKAKVQAERIVSVNGAACSLHIGAITHFRSEVLRFYWHDPSPEKSNPIEVSVSAAAWRHYYTPIMEVLKTSEQVALRNGNDAQVNLEDLDVGVGVHRSVLKLLVAEQWGGAQHAAVEARTEIARAGFQPDGLMVKAGESWRERFSDISFN